MVNLEGRRIVITGGSMGLGHAVAQECCRRGAYVSLVARNKDNLLAALQQLPSSIHNTIHVADVSDLNQVSELAQELLADFRCIHGLVNCAGTYGSIGKIDTTDPVEFTNAVKINLLATYYMCHYLVPLMKGISCRGKIVNYSGGGGSTPLPNYSAYACSKAGVIRLTENMALELMDDKIDVNVVAPGFVPTRIHLRTLEVGPMKAGKAFYESTRRQMEEKSGSSVRSAQLTSFLLSSKSDGISGKLISAVWDPWEDIVFQQKVRSKNFATLRRIDDKLFKELV